MERLCIGRRGSSAPGILNDRSLKRAWYVSIPLVGSQSACVAPRCVVSTKKSLRPRVPNSWYEMLLASLASSWFLKPFANGDVSFPIRLLSCRLPSS